MKLSFFYKISISIFCFLLISFSVSAQFEIGMKEYKGMRYKIHQTGKGKAITDSSIFQIQMKIFNSEDSLLRDTYTEDFSDIVDLREEENRKISLVEILMKGKIGDILTIFIQTDSIFQGSAASNRPNFIPEGSWVRYELQLVRDYTPQEYEDVKVTINQLKEQQVNESLEEVQIELDSIHKTQIEYIENTYFVEKGIKEYQKTESGLFYVVEKQGTEIKEGERISANYKGTLLITDEKFDSSYDRGEPLEVIIGKGQVIKGWDEGIPLIGRGGKGILYIPSNLAFGTQGTGNAISPNSMLIFEVEVVDKYFEANVNQYDDEEIEETDEGQEEQQTTSQKDPNTYYIDDNQEDYIENVYLKLNDITDYKKTASGLFYRIEKQGTLVKKGDKLRVHYEGTFLMSGEKFDSSFDRGEPFEVTVEMGNLIEGWEEGIPLIGKGGKGTLYIPAKLAYGKEKTANIPPNSILMYRIEILEK